jgi:hypothetical protein
VTEILLGMETLLNNLHWGMRQNRTHFARKKIKPQEMSLLTITD